MDSETKETNKELSGFIGQLAKASDGMLATVLAKECAAFLYHSPHTLQEEVIFLRDLRDKSVFGAGASTFVMNVFNILLKDHPETDIERDVRHEKLKTSGWG